MQAQVPDRERLKLHSGYRFFARGSRVDLRDDGVECGTGVADVAAVVVDVDAVCVAAGTVSIDVVAVVLGGAGDDGVIVERRLREIGGGGGGINNESSRARGVGGARDVCSSCCRALSVADLYRGLS